MRAAQPHEGSSTLHCAWSLALEDEQGPPAALPYAHPLVQVGHLELHVAQAPHRDHDAPWQGDLQAAAVSSSWNGHSHQAGAMQL